MAKNKELDAKQYIHAMELPIKLDYSIKLWFLDMPNELHEKLLDLVETCYEKRGEIFKDTYSLLSTYINNYLRKNVPGLLQVKDLKKSNNGQQWIITNRKFSKETLDDIRKILEFWIRTRYIVVPDRRYVPDKESIKLCAEEVCKYLKESDNIFENSISSKQVSMADDSELIEELLPSIAAVNVLNGQEINKSAYGWLRSEDGELVSELRESLTHEHYSYAVNFDVIKNLETEKSFLKLSCSLKRWISLNKKNLPIYLATDKYIQVRVSKDKLVPACMHYDSYNKCINWKSDSKQMIQRLYGIQLPDADRLCCYPEDYLYSEYPCWIPYKTGDEFKNHQSAVKMHSGCTHKDRKSICDDVIQYLQEFTSAKSAEELPRLYKINQSLCSSKILQGYFDKEMHLESNMAESFKNQIKTILDGRKLKFTICFSHHNIYGKDAAEEFQNVLKGHMKDTDLAAEITLKDMTTIIENERNLKLEDERHDFDSELYEKFPDNWSDTDDVKASPTDVHIVVFIIHEKAEYQNNRTKLDPHDEIENVLLKSGYIPVVFTEEKYAEQIKKKEAVNRVIRMKLLTVYARLGVFYPLNPEQKKTKNHKRCQDIHNGVLAGIYINGMKVMTVDNCKINPITIAVICNYASMSMTVYTKLETDSNKHLEIECPYFEFPMRFKRFLGDFNKGTTVSTSRDTIKSALDRIDKINRSTVIMFDGDHANSKNLYGVTDGFILKHKGEKTNDYVVLTADKQEADTGVFDKVNFKYTDYENFCFIRLRHDSNVPDYFPAPIYDNNMNQKRWTTYSKIYRCFPPENGKKAETADNNHHLYYFLDARRNMETAAEEIKLSRGEIKKAVTHRNLLEIYVLHLSEEQDITEFLNLCFNIRFGSVSWSNFSEQTILPVPLHAAGQAFHLIK